MGKKAKELPNIMAVGTRAPKQRSDTVPHWKVWRFASANPGIPWRKGKTA